MAIPLIIGAILSPGGSIAGQLNTVAADYAWSAPGTARIVMQSDGVVSFQIVSSEAGTDEWIVGSPRTGVGSLFHCRFVYVSGDAMVNDDTWLDLTSDQDVYISVAGASDQTWTGYLQFSLDGGSTVCAQTTNFGVQATYVGP